MSVRVHLWLELKARVHEDREQKAPLVNIFQALTQLHRLDAADDYDVIAERRPVGGAAAEIDAGVRPDLPLEEQRSHRRGLEETDVAGRDEGAQLGRQVEVRRAVQDEDAGVDEVRLPFVLVRAQRRQQAEGGLDAGACLSEPQPLAVPQTERPAGERGDSEKGVEPAALAI